MRTLCWLRRDLRLRDNSALELATSIGQQSAVLFVFDTCILSALRNKLDRRVDFIYKSLVELDHELKKLGSQLIVRIGDPIREIPFVASQLGIAKVFCSQDYEEYAVQRDDQVRSKLDSFGIEFHPVKDHVIFDGNEIATQSGTPFTVYTPFSRAWRNRFSQADYCSERAPNLDNLLPRSVVESASCKWGLSEIGFEPTDLQMTAGELGAMSRLSAFLPKMSRYKQDRDFPAIDGCSSLSTDLRFGTISVRECVRNAIELGPDGETWLNELIWREFFHHILVNFPVVTSEPFRPQFRNLVWPGEKDHFDKWRNGHTGFPIVDAAMRCLNATGLMPNRLRMVVASFLTKDLLIDYRWGEAYFAEMLLDFDLASNNGNWQWSSSTGCDAQPTFRIFNPILQSQKFDPKGQFIRQWVPELSRLSDDLIHFPAANRSACLFEGVELGVDYPEPIVDHAVQRVKALELLKSCSS